MSTAQGHFQTSTPHRGIWRPLSWVVGSLIALGLVAVGVLHFTPVLSERRAQQSRLHQLTAEVEQERQVIARNQRLEELLKHDAEFAALLARDRLDLMRAGEKIYRFAPPRTDHAPMRR